jgi:hypothetical protein
MIHRRLHFAVLALTLTISSCAVRSISNPGRPWGGGNTTYAGELSDFDVIGGTSAEGIGPGAEVKLRPHMRVLVVQSGAAFPDERMLSGLAAQFDIGAASGIPTQALQEHGMRFAAARGGFDAIIAYWGVLESSERVTEGVAASWVPIAGMFVPDASQRMRIRLRVVIVDVHTGRWRTLLPEPIDDERASSMVTRSSSDRDQVELLMGAAIPAAIDAITSGI